MNLSDAAERARYKTIIEMPTRSLFLQPAVYPRAGTADSRCFFFSPMELAALANSSIAYRRSAVCTPAVFRTLAQCRPPAIKRGCEVHRTFACQTSKSLENRQRPCPRRLANRAVWFFYRGRRIGRAMLAGYFAEANEPPTAPITTKLMLPPTVP